METGGLKLQVRWISFKALRKPEMPIGVGFAPTYLPTYLQSHPFGEKSRPPSASGKKWTEIF